MAKIQAIIDQVTTTTTNAIQTIEGIAQDADATAITEAVLTATRLARWVKGLLVHYRAAISKAADGELDNLVKIQAMIDAVNGAA